MAAAAILDFKIFKLLMVGTVKKVNCISVPNFIEIAQNAEIWCFWIFQNGDMWLQLQTASLPRQSCVVDLSETDHSR